MKGHFTRRRTRNRRSSAGFTLIELMVVVVLISILSALAAPAMTEARNDRLAFSYARQAAEIVHNARSRAVGRGAAQLVIYTNTTGGGTRGMLSVWEATDALIDGQTPIAGPNPVARCRIREGANSQWARAFGGAELTDFKAQAVEGLNINGTAGSINVTDDISMVGRRETTPGNWTATPAWVLCITPNGTTYYGEGASPAAAVDAMQLSDPASPWGAPPFKGMVELEVSRKRNGNQSGLKRRVIIAGSGAPRIQSE